MNATFKEGDKVQWLHTSHSGRSWSLATREGTVALAGHSYCTVKMRNGRKTHVSTKELRLSGEKSKLTEFFEAKVSTMEGGR